MKNLIKLTISFFVCGLVLLSGCGTISSSLPNELIGQNFDNPDTLNIFAPYFFSNSTEEDAYLKQQWIDEMSARYGVQLNIISDRNGLSSYTGMYYFNSYETLVSAIQNDIAVPLEGYLADNPAWNALPDEIKSAFTIDGHIYAVPSSCYYSMNARSVCTDTLEQTEIEITDPESLKEYALAMKQIGDYEYVIGSTGADALGDILRAYGLYLDEYSGHSFSYDPSEGCIVDFLTKDSAITALEYLRGLYTAGVLRMFSDYKTPGPYNDFIAGNSPTYYDETIIDDQYTEILTLNPSYPQLLDSSMTGYFMIKDTPEPEEAANFFVNMLFGSEENYLECSLGLSDNYIVNSDGSITLKLIVNDEGGVDSFPIPNLVGALPGAFPHSNQNFSLEVTGTLTPELAASVERSKQKSALIDSAVRQGVALKVPFSYQQIYAVRFIEKKADIKYLYFHCVQDAIIDTDYTVQEIVAQYRLDMLNMGGNAMLDEMNTVIGKQTAYYYG